MWRIANLAIMAGGLAVAGCTMNNAPGAGFSPARRPSLPIEAIAMRTSSFWHSATTGSPFHSEWRIEQSGEGTFRSIEASRDATNTFHQNDVTRRFSVGRRGFRRIEALLRAAEPFAGGRVPCDSIPFTDSTIGTVSWTVGGTTSGAKFNQGCQAKAAIRIFRRFDRAEALVTKWGSGGRIVRSEVLRSRPDPAPVE